MEKRKKDGAKQEQDKKGDDLTATKGGSKTAKHANIGTAHL